MGSIAAYPNIVAWLARLHARPAFRRSVEAGCRTASPIDVREKPVMNSVLALSGPGLRAACIGLAMAIALSAGVRAAAFDDPADLAAIRAAEEALEGGASGGALAQYYTQDAIRLDSVAPGQQRGRTQIAAALGQQAGAPVSHHLLESSIVSDGRMACDALEMQIVRKAQDGSQRQEEWRRLDVFTKLDGHWLIAQEHISGPADRSTGAILRAGPLQVRGPAQWPAVMFADPALQPQAAKAALRHWVKAALSVIGIGPAMGFFDPTGNVLLYGEFAPGNVRGSSEIHDYYAGIMGTTAPRARSPSARATACAAPAEDGSASWRWCRSRWTRKPARR
jgi:ketosteroid isomerase-like protein